ncbi:hypothetical protein L9F63_023120, partial [Diploptera punctata]
TLKVRESIRGGLVNIMNAFYSEVCGIPLNNKTPQCVSLLFRYPLMSIAKRNINLESEIVAAARDKIKNTLSKQDPEEKVDKFRNENMADKNFKFPIIP